MNRLIPNSWVRPELPRFSFFGHIFYGNGDTITSSTHTQKFHFLVKTGGLHGSLYGLTPFSCPVEFVYILKIFI